MTDPVEFAQTQTTIPIEAIPMETLTFMDERVKPNLPTYTDVSLVPSKSYNGIENIAFTNTISSIYEDTVTWKRNLFKIPTGNTGKGFINLLTEWISNFNKSTSFQGLAMKIVMILPNLMLQKPSATSKAKNHSKSLEGSLRKWNDGKIEEI